MYLYCINFAVKIFRVMILNEKLRKNLKYGGVGVAVGAINGMFGAGGGMLAVPLLKKIGFEQKQAHANAVAIILPITVISAALYLLKGTVNISDSIAYIPTGLIGSYIGTLIIKRISPLWLKRIFGGFMVYAGVRLLLK